MALLVLLLLAGGCGWHLGPAAAPPRPVAGARPIALVTTGSALGNAAAIERVRGELVRQTGHPVVVLDRPVAPQDPAVRELAGRLAKDHPAVAGYDWRERRCTTDPAVLTAIVHRADGV